MQTADSLSISLPLRNVLMKNVDILYSDVMLKVNVAKIRYVKIIDLLHEIEWEDSRNKVQLHDESLEVLLIKKEPGVTWATLNLEGKTKEELMARRDESLKRYYKCKEDRYKQAQHRGYELDKLTVGQQMKVESHQRKHIKNTKKALQDEAEEEMYNDLE